MNKRLLYILIVGICISLLGIIAVQFFWIRNAFQVKEAQFDRSVNDALGSAVNKLETKENMHFISRNYEGDSILSILQAFSRDTSNTLKTRLDSLLENSEVAPPRRRRPPQVQPRPTGVLHYSYQINLGQGEEVHDSVVVMVDPVQQEDVALTFEWNDQLDELDSLVRENDQFFFHAVHDAEVENLNMLHEHQIITLAPETQGNTTIQYRFSSPNDIVRLQQQNHRRSQSPATADKRIKRLDNKAKKIQEVIKQMALELETKPAPLQQRINKRGLQTTLQEAFANKGIAIPFEFAVMTPSNDSNPIPIQSAGFKKEFSKSAHKVSLFPNDLFGKPDLLLVHFPDQKSEIFKSISLLLLGSILFTLVIILTSSASIVVMIRQKKISDIKTDFINNMTHEFKTPIATISIAADSINNQKVIAEPDKIRNFTRIIKEENNRMNARVEQVLQMALLDSRDFKLRLKRIDMHQLIEKAADHYKLQIEQREGSLITALDATAFVVEADEDHIRNVLMNLLDNANKYSIIKPAITIFTHNRGNKFYFGVSDRGMGMSQDAQRKAFDKFFRVTSGNIHKIKGFGLGLSYVKAIVLAHHGEITVHSEVGKGSRFEICLPVAAT